MRHRWLVTTACLCVALGQGGVTLATVYDFSTGAGTQHFGYGISAALPMPPATNTVPSSPFFGASYTAIGFSDNLPLTTNVVEDPGNTLVPAMRFVFSVSEPRSSINRLDILWEGGAGEDGLQQVWLWNAVSGSYVLIGSQENVKMPFEGTV